MAAICPEMISEIDRWSPCGATPMKDQEFAASRREDKNLDSGAHFCFGVQILLLQQTGDGLR